MSRNATLATLAFALLSASAALAHPTGGKPEAKQAWVRESLPGQEQTAAYLILENPDHEADWLAGVSCDCAKSVEIHRMVREGERMKMEPLPRLLVPAKGRAVLDPGGTHLMLFGLRKPLKAGEKVRLRLRFAVAGEVAVDAVVKGAEGKRDAGR